MTQLEQAPRPNHEAIPPEELPGASSVPHQRIDPHRNAGLIWTGVLVLLVVIAVLWKSVF